MGFGKKKKGDWQCSTSLWYRNTDWFKIKFILIISSVILIIMMVVAVCVRIKIKDNISEILPALAYLILGIIILQQSI